MKFGGKLRHLQFLVLLTRNARLGIVFSIHVSILTLRVIIVTSATTFNRVRELRLLTGWTQAELAQRSGASRTAITAIESGSTVPSVNVALGIARALRVTVEELFGPAGADSEELWVESRPSIPTPYWTAEVGGRIIRYPASPGFAITGLPDVDPNKAVSRPGDTLVLACCDPAAGYLAAAYAAEYGQRLLVLPRTSRESIELLAAGKIHVAGLHFSTPEEPGANANYVRARLGTGYRLMRMADWSEGIAVAPEVQCRSAQALKRAELRWVGREPGSGARAMPGSISRRFCPSAALRSQPQGSCRCDRFGLGPGRCLCGTRRQRGRLAVHATGTGVLRSLFPGSTVR